MLKRNDFDVYEIAEDGEELYLNRFYGATIFELAAELRDDIKAQELNVENEGNGEYTLYDKGQYICYKAYVFQ